MELLDSVPKHRSILFPEELLVHVHIVIRRDTDEVLIECRVVNLAQRETVGNDRVAAGLAIRDDVRREAMAVKGRQAVDGRGVDRLVSALFERAAA